MADAQPTKSDLEEEFALLRGAVSEYPELAPIVENLPDEVPDPSGPSPSPAAKGPVESSGDGDPTALVTPSGGGVATVPAETAVPASAPGFEFHDHSGFALNRWRVSLSEKQEALEARQDIYQNRVRDLNVQLKQGRITTSEWFRRMRGQIRKLHVSAYGIGHSGKFDELDLSDYGRIGNTVQRQYRVLDRWRQQIDTEGLDSFSLPQLNDRAQKYGAAARESFERGYQSEVGMDTSVLPAEPGDGSTECRSRCKCRWAITILDKAAGHFNATWTLGQAEHCETCLNRSMEWVQLEVRNNSLVSDFEPIFAR